MSDAQPVIAEKSLDRMEVEAGKDRTGGAPAAKRQPAVLRRPHKRQRLYPGRIQGGRDGTIPFCGCKNSGKKPRCDGTHRSL